MVRKPRKWRKFWTLDYTTTVDNTKSNGSASMNQVGSWQSTLKILPIELILSTPAITENLGHCHDLRSKTLVEQGVHGDLGGGGLDWVNCDVGWDKGCAGT